MPSDPSKRFQIILDKDLKKRIKAWASKQKDKPNLSSAIRALVEQGLDKGKK